MGLGDNVLGGTAEGGFDGQFVFFFDGKAVGNQTEHAGQAIHLLQHRTRPPLHTFGFALVLVEQAQADIDAAFFVAQLVELGVHLIAGGLGLFALADEFIKALVGGIDAGLLLVHVAQAGLAALVNAGGLFIVLAASFVEAFTSLVQLLAAGLQTAVFRLNARNLAQALDMAALALFDALQQFIDAGNEMASISCRRS